MSRGMRSYSISKEELIGEGWSCRRRRTSIEAMTSRLGKLKEGKARSDSTVACNGDCAHVDKLESSSKGAVENEMLEAVATMRRRLNSASVLKTGVDITQDYADVLGRLIWSCIENRLKRGSWR